MKYAIIGAGGTGGSLGFFLTKAGKDVTLIARGKHLEAIRKNGLGMERLWDHKREMIPVKACTVEEYSDTPDVILVCVKGYSMTEQRRISGFFPCKAASYNRRRGGIQLSHRRT